MNRYKLETGVRSRTYGFTMAEILLSLTIIGVVAALTLPSLTGNINERTWNTQRKALYSRMSQAIALMPNLNGYGKYAGTNSGGVVTVTKDTAAETFVTNGLAKVLKINNICDNTHLSDCGIVSSFTNLAASALSMPTKLSELNNLAVEAYSNGLGGRWGNPQSHIDTKAVAFETANGEHIVAFYNPQCLTRPEHSSGYYSFPYMCANFIYDLNGTKGPNTVGKDIGFMSALYASDSAVVAPMPLAKDYTNKPLRVELPGKCLSMDTDSRAPNINELSSMFYNKNLLGTVADGAYWSSELASSTLGWVIDFQRGGSVQRQSITGSRYWLRCVKR